MDALAETAGGRGPDACIDPVGTEAHGLSVDNVIDMAKQKIGIGTDRPHALRQAILACRKGGTASVPGVYCGLLDNMPFGALMNKGLTIKTSQTHVHRYLQPLLKLIEEDKIDPRVIISHRLNINDAPVAYDRFKNDQDEFRKVMLKP